jgi:hypothetical protein
VLPIKGLGRVVIGLGHNRYRGDVYRGLQAAVQHIREQNLPQPVPFMLSKWPSKITDIWRFYQTNPQTPTALPGNSALSSYHF